MYEVNKIQILVTFRFNLQSNKKKTLRLLFYDF